MVWSGQQTKSKDLDRLRFDQESRPSQPRPQPPERILRSGQPMNVRARFVQTAEQLRASPYPILAANSHWQRCNSVWPSRSSFPKQITNFSKQLDFRRRSGKCWGWLLLLEFVDPPDGEEQHKRDYEEIQCGSYKLSTA